MVKTGERLLAKMDDLSLHVLDIVENAITGDASRISVILEEKSDSDSLVLEISDDGSGMDADTVVAALDPFFSSKAGKKVGLGLPLLHQAAEEAGGGLAIESVPGQGTTVRATFQLSHIDCKPLGDMAMTMRVLRATHPDIEFRFEHKKTADG